MKYIRFFLFLNLLNPAFVWAEIVTEICNEEYKAVQSDKLSKQLVDQTIIDNKPHAETVTLEVMADYSDKYNNFPSFEEQSTYLKSINSNVNPSQNYKILKQISLSNMNDQIQRINDNVVTVYKVLNRAPDETSNLYVPLKKYYSCLIKYFRDKINELPEDTQFPLTKADVKSKLPLLSEIE